MWANEPDPPGQHGFLSRPSVSQILEKRRNARLAGTCFQAVEQLQFNVFFERMK